MSCNDVLYCHGEGVTHGVYVTSGGRASRLASAGKSGASPSGMSSTSPQVAMATAALLTFHILIICGPLALRNINLTQTNTDCVQMSCVEKEADAAFVTSIVCVF